MSISEEQREKNQNDMEEWSKVTLAADPVLAKLFDDLAEEYKRSSLALLWMVEQGAQSESDIRAGLMQLSPTVTDGGGTQYGSPPLEEKLMAIITHVALKRRKLS